MSRADSHVLEEESRRAFINLLPSAWVHRDEVPDYHIDMEIVIADRGKVTNEVFWVQLKATENILHSGEVVPYSIETKHLKYYEGCRLPVVILLWVKPENTFYYLFAQQYIREKLSKEDPDWRSQITKTIEFPANSKLKDAIALKKIATDGYLYIIQKEPNIGSKAGLATPWLDGIPKSNDEVLKEHVVKALLCMRSEDYNGAIAEYKYVLRVVCKTRSTVRMAILMNLGFAHCMLGQNAEALDNFDAVLELAEEITEKDAQEGKATALGSIGVVYRDKGDFENALKYLQDSLKVHREIGYRQGEATTLDHIGTVYSVKGDFENALKYLQDSLEISREIGSRVGEASALDNIGLVCRDKGDLSKALKYHQDSLKINKEICSKQGEASALGNIGSVYRDKGDLSKALKYHQDSLKISREIGYRQIEANQLGSIGLIYGVKGDFENALRYLQDSLKIHREIGFRVGEASDLSNIGSVHCVTGDLSKALRYLQDSLKIHREIGYRQGEATTLGNIGIIYRDKGDLDNALIYLLDALTLLNRYGLTYGLDTIQGAIDSINQRLQC